MESNHVTTPLSEGEMWVNFVFEPEDPEDGAIIPVHVPVQRSLLSTEESAKSIIPLLLSRTTVPEFFQRNCLDEFIRELSEHVCSSPSDMHHVYVYGHVVFDCSDPTERFCWYYLGTESNVQSVKLEEALDCAICLQQLPVGFEAAKLPCSHVYHHGCIVKWFDRSIQCPLCRSPLSNSIMYHV
ncbi:E3 ubiquitin-protein ligase ATL15-like [Corylus avellana]|uniref:E3 ubiquitin-protein ligase ATL15-like n=1 Tax=Corylus avellana TaxID=13451 RepID=UPI00286C8594|nr:E3 ubiquitin-protein ligase ATL15-like [Corylus avellana]